MMLLEPFSNLDRLRTTSSPPPGALTSGRGPTLIKSKVLKHKLLVPPPTHPPADCWGTSEAGVTLQTCLKFGQEGLSLLILWRQVTPAGSPEKGDHPWARPLFRRKEQFLKGLMRRELSQQNSQQPSEDEKKKWPQYFIYLFIYLCLFRAAPAALGASQARSQIGATAALNPLSEARDWTHVLMDPSWIR